MERVRTNGTQMTRMEQIRDRIKNGSPLISQRTQIKMGTKKRQRPDGYRE